MRPTPSHCTAAVPLATRATPMMPPTVACVVDTGMCSSVATTSHTPVATMTHSMPTMSSSGKSSKASACVMPPLQGVASVEGGQ